MKPNLSEISKPINAELDQFKIHFKEALKSNVGIVDLISNYILKQKGKKIRPLLVLLTSNVTGGINDRTFRGATLVELLHTATLVHDDVVDGAEKRRGLPSINAVWKNKVAVLMGDYLLARGLLLSVDGTDYDFLKVVSQAVKRMSEGELLQIKKTRKLDIDEETYFQIISDKTASLISTCCEIGAISANGSEKQIVAMRDFGEKLGLIFQIRDDILDFVGTSSIIGKPLGADIKEKKITLPLIHALREAPKSEASSIIKNLKSDKKRKIEEILDFVKKYNGIEYSEQVANRLADECRELVSNFPESDSRTSLLNLVDFVLKRKN